MHRSPWLKSLLCCPHKLSFPDPSGWEERKGRLPKGRGLKLIDAVPGKTALEDIISVVDGVMLKRRAPPFHVSGTEPTS